MNRAWPNPRENKTATRTRGRNWKGCRNQTAKGLSRGKTQRKPSGGDLRTSPPAAQLMHPNPADEPCMIKLTVPRPRQASQHPTSYQLSLCVSRSKRDSPSTFCRTLFSRAASAAQIAPVFSDCGRPLSTQGRHSEPGGKPVEEPAILLFSADEPNRAQPHPAGLRPRWTWPPQVNRWLAGEGQAVVSRRALFASLRYNFLVQIT